MRLKSKDCGSGGTLRAVRPRSRPGPPPPTSEGRLEARGVEGTYLLPLDNGLSSVASPRRTIMDLNWVPGLVVVLLLLWFVFAWLSLISKDEPYDDKARVSSHKKVKLG